MSKRLLRYAALLLAVTSLAGCTGGKGSSEVKPLTEEEFAIAYEQIALTIPLAVEKTTGMPIQTNNYRKLHGTSVPELKDGNDIVLIEGGELKYEDEDTGFTILSPFSITWSYLVNDKYADFTFETDRKGVLSAVPGYPWYEPVYDSGGNEVGEIPPRISGRLYAIVNIGEHSKTINLDVILSPQVIVEYVDLLAARELTAGDVVGVRGYVTGIFTDWNTAGIADGKWGMGLYRLDSGFVDSMEVGELVEVIGHFSNFNGLTQLQWIKKVKVLDHEDEKWDHIKRPETQDKTLDDLEDQLSRSANDLTGPLQDKDNAIIRFTSPFKFKHVEDRDGTVVGFAGFDLSGKTHTNVVLTGKTSDNKSFDVKLSINYHMGGAEQLKFKNWLEQHQNDDIYYTGPLSSYNEYVLGPYELSSPIYGETLRTTL